MTYLQVGLSGFVIGLILLFVFNVIMRNITSGKTDEEKIAIYKILPRWVFFVCSGIFALLVISVIIVAVSLIMGV